MRSRAIALLAGGLSLAAVAVPASAQWQVRTVDGGDPEINDINEGETILDNPATPTAGTDTPDVINYSGEADIGLIGGDATFPGGVGGTEDFALEGLGVVDIIGGTTGTFNLVVNSDDGYRVRVDGTVPNDGVDALEFTAQRDDPDAGAQVVTTTLNDGDVVRLTFFERAGGDNVEFFADSDGNLGTTGDQFLVGSAASGIDIVPIPEPATAGLLGLGALGLLARRRR
jgi:hypothetical protein